MVRVGLGMTFFRNRDFLLLTWSKIPKIPGSGSEFENPEKFPSDKSRKSRNPRNRDRDIKTSKNLESKISKISKSRGSRSKIPGDLKIGIFSLSLGIFIPEIFWASGFLSPGSGIFYLQDIPGIGIFSFDEISRQKATYVCGRFDLKMTVTLFI